MTPKQYPAARDGAYGRGQTARTSKSSRLDGAAGRNIPAAIGVGVGMLAVVLVGLLVYPPAFMFMVMIASGLGVWEVLRGVAQNVRGIPIFPVVVGVICMPPAAYYLGGEGLFSALILACLLVFIWWCFDPNATTATSIFSGIFTLAWVPFFASFVLLQLRQSSGSAQLLSFSLNWPDRSALQVVATLLVVVANDTCGYCVGSLWGKHPLAPRLSPKKSWEGSIGSLAGGMLMGVCVGLVLLQEPWWWGCIFGFVLVIAATMGDLFESMVKRELGMKDMSMALPGHGGLMDRLDSILFAAPIAYMLFAVFDALRS